MPVNPCREEDPKELLREWRRMFTPTAKMQASLAALGALAAGATAYLQNSAGKADIAAAFGTAAACDVRHLTTPHCCWGRTAFLLLGRCCCQALRTQK